MQVLDQPPAVGGDAMDELDLGALFADRRFELCEPVVAFANFALQARRQRFDARGRRVQGLRQDFALLSHRMDRAELRLFLLHLARLAGQAPRKIRGAAFQGGDVLRFRSCFSRRGGSALPCLRKLLDETRG
ncbi:MAG TPA: hypothetical protein VN224_03130, partial [Xanthomonadales bacterium]|nr:hypothetical protein [Xanthomonadales bacterium]